MFCCGITISWVRSLSHHSAGVEILTLLVWRGCHILSTPGIEEKLSEDWYNRMPVLPTNNLLFIKEYKSMEASENAAVFK